MAQSNHYSIEVGLTAAIVTVQDPTPFILAVGRYPKQELGVPSGPFNPMNHRTLEIGLRGWVREQTHLQIGYVEQLYTFGDRGRQAITDDQRPHFISVGYLALTRPGANIGMHNSGLHAWWRPWYDFFPWEDWRNGRPAILDEYILPAMRDWAAQEKDTNEGKPNILSRHERLQLAYGEAGTPWDEERILERYELLYEAGLVAEALRDGHEMTVERHIIHPELEKRKGFEPDFDPIKSMNILGLSMAYDHRRILATAIARLRGKLKYRPVVFELMPETFTLTELQKTVEAISGRHLHKQNFRRLVENTALVEATGETSTATGGRPAALYRYRSSVIRERPRFGFRV